jgi:DNA-binding XRE family transcriptional regulator
MPVHEGNLAQNVRRLAGMHLASIEKLAEYCQVSRPTMQAIVTPDLTIRSRPRAETALKIAEAFGVTLNALYQEPDVCLGEALDHFRDAPIARLVEPPPVELTAMEKGKLGVDSWLELRRRR